MQKNKIFAIILIIVAVLVGIFIYFKSTQHSPSITEHNQNSTEAKPPLVILPDPESYQGSNLRQPLSISSSFFSHPEAYVNEEIGFAFDFENGTMESLNPIVKSDGNNEDAEMTSTGALFAKTSVSYLVNGFVGVLKFPFKPENPDLKNQQVNPQDNLMYISIKGCGKNPSTGQPIYNCYEQEAKEYNTFEKNYYNSITDISQVQGDPSSPGESGIQGVKYSWRKYTPNLRFDFYSKINTGSSTEDRLLLQNLFKTRATFRVLDKN